MRIVKIAAKQDILERVKAELTAMLAPTRAEAGCVQYNLHQDTNDKSLFYFYEIWSDQQALDQHMQTPHLQNLLAKSDELFAGPLDAAQVEIVD